MSGELNHSQHATWENCEDAQDTENCRDAQDSEKRSDEQGLPSTAASTAPGTPVLVGLTQTQERLLLKQRHVRYRQTDAAERREGGRRREEGGRRREEGGRRRASQAGPAPAARGRPAPRTR